MTLSNVEKRLIDNLVAIGIIPEEALEYGQEYVLRCIRRSFDRVSKLEVLNPDRIVGAKMRLLREEMDLSQERMMLLVNERLSQIGAKPIPRQSSMSRMESGTYAVDYKVALAFAHALQVTPESFCPWEWDNFFDNIREPKLSDRITGAKNGRL